MAKKKCADELVRRVMVSLRPENIRTMEYLSLTYKGGFSSWVQDQLDGVQVDSCVLNEKRMAKHSDYARKVFAAMRDVLGEETIVQQSSNPQYDFITADGASIVITMKDGEPVVNVKRKVVSQEFALKDVLSEFDAIDGVNSNK